MGKSGIGAQFLQGFQPGEIGQALIQDEKIEIRLQAGQQSRQGSRKPTGPALRHVLQHGQKHGSDHGIVFDDGNFHAALP